MKIEKIKLVFLNGDEATIKANQYKDLEISGIKTEIAGNTGGKDDGSFYKFIECDKFCIEILPDGYMQYMKYEDERVGKRIEDLADLNWLTITYSNGHNDIYYMPWCNENSTFNKYQKSKLVKRFDEKWLKLKVERVKR